MTPEKAVKQLIEEDGIKLGGIDEIAVLLMFKAAIGDETRRCAKRVKAVATLVERQTLPKMKHPETQGMVQNIIEVVRNLSDDILTTGGLEAEP